MTFLILSLTCDLGSRNHHVKKVFGFWNKKKKPVAIRGQRLQMNPAPFWPASQILVCPVLDDGPDVVPESWDRAGQLLHSRQLDSVHSFVQPEHQGRLEPQGHVSLIVHLIKHFKFLFTILYAEPKTICRWHWVTLKLQFNFNFDPAAHI